MNAKIIYRLNGSEENNEYIIDTANQLTFSVLGDSADVSGIGENGILLRLAETVMPGNYVEDAALVQAFIDFRKIIQNETTESIIMEFYFSLDNDSASYQKFINRIQLDNVTLSSESLVNIAYDKVVVELGFQCTKL